MTRRDSALLGSPPAAGACAGTPGPTAVVDGPRAHPRTIGWLGTASLAMGGSNQMLFVVGALIAAQGTSAIPLLAVGLVLGWMALPGWIELVLMWPERVGGIASSCAEAFRPYSPVLANLTGVCYWWGWIPTCGVTALLAATALHALYLPFVSVHVLASIVVLAFLALNLLGIRVVTRVAVGMATVSALLAFAAAVLPVWTGSVDWHRALSWHVQSPFHGWFGTLSSAMAGLYLVGFAAPAFEAAACHVGETRDPVRHVPRAMVASAGMATLYFAVLPAVWLGVLGPHPLADDPTLVNALGPVFAPALHGLAGAAVVWFLVANMLHGTLQPLAGAARTLSQLADDGLLPRVLSRRSLRDVPWVASVLTGVVAIVFLWFDDPPPVIAAANLAYLIGIGLPSVAVWLLRRNEPDVVRPWRAPRGTVVLGVAAALVWAVSTLLGFQQYGLEYVILGLVLAYAGSAAYAWRRWRDARAARVPQARVSLHLKLTGSMLAVVALDGAGYLVAVAHVPRTDGALITVLQDIFVAVAVLSISVGLVLPGMVSHAVVRVTEEARRLAAGPLAGLTEALEALGRGDLRHSSGAVEISHVGVMTRDEVGVMARAFNTMQDRVATAAEALEAAREQLRESRERLQTLADRDPLTGLLNRRRFEEELDRATRLALRGGTAWALLLLDIDSFKLVNDTRGHTVGDDLLRQVACALEQRLRPSDVTARIGGDEFAVLLPVADAEVAAHVAQDLVETLRRETVVAEEDGHRLRITVSIGVTMVQPGLTPGELLVAADVALYDAKTGGRNRIAIAGMDPDRHRELRSRQDWLDALRNGLEQDAFELHAQPVLELESGRIVEHELLLRLRVGEELLTPGAFLPLAEQLGLVQEIDQWVVRTAHELVMTDASAGRCRRFAVNLSGASVTDPALLSLLEQLAGRLPAEAPRLVLELTETAAISSLDAAAAFAARVSALGYELALDDFGAGFGSFYYLKRLPFDYIKIDGDFVRDLVGNATDRHVVRAIVAIAQGMGMRTIAEFVEDAATIALLRDLGVDYAQGYAIGRPEPVPVPRRGRLPGQRRPSDWAALASSA